MTRIKDFYKYLWIVAALVFTTGLAIQYPLQTTFPIGGDAIRYISRVEEVISAWHRSALIGITTFLTNSWYPGAIALLAVSKLLPLSWPDRFVWWMTLGHLVTSYTIGFVLYKLSNWRAAAAGIAIWGLAMMSVTRHVEDGTLAQLWSLPAVVLFLYALSRGSLPGILGGLATVFIIHPISGIICLITHITTLIATYPIRHLRKNSKASLLAIALLPPAVAFALNILFPHYTVFLQTTAESQKFLITNALTTAFGPFILLAAAGFVLLTQNFYSSPFVSITLLNFAVLSWLLTFNYLLGAPIFAHRLQTYFALSTTILAAQAFPLIVGSAFTNKMLRGLFVTFFFLSLGSFAWHENAQIFNAYESPSRYLRPHPEELSAIQWMGTNLPAKSIILSTRTTRHPEWIPILSHHEWKGLQGDDPLWHLESAALKQYLKNVPYTHLVFFKLSEKPAEVFPNGIEHFPVIYETKEVLILQLRQL